MNTKQQQQQHSVQPQHSIKNRIKMSIPEMTICIIIKDFMLASKASNTASINIQANFSKVINKVVLKISVLSKKS